MPSFNVKYTIIFSIIVCSVCAVFVSGAAVLLADAQDLNKALDKKRNVLLAAGVLGADEEVSKDEILKRFERFQPVLVDLTTGKEVPSEDPGAFDQQKAKKNPDTSKQAPQNLAGIFRVPNQALVYKVKGDDGHVEMLVLPIEGYGLWSTLYGFLAVSTDTTTIKGLTYYQHGETPGLGGEVDNPRWKSLWVGRKAYDQGWQPKISVIKGAAGPVDQDPHHVDGLSGSTITSRGVTNMMQFWLGDHGFGPYLKNLREGKEAA